MPMTTDGMFAGVVVSVQGTNPGPASGITYTIDVNMANGVVRFTGVKPSWNRPPEAFDTKAASPGTGLLVAFVAGYMQAFIPEFFDTQSC